MKTVLLTLVTLGCLKAFAGGGPTHSSPPCLPIDKAEIVLKEGQVLDRGGNQVKYRIIMKAERCQSEVAIRTRKAMYLHYDAPVQRSEDDGIMLGKKFDWSNTAHDIEDSFSLNEQEETVTEIGLKIYLGGRVDDNSPLTSIPSGFIGGKGTALTFLGNAFPTHTIMGPFTK